MPLDIYGINDKGEIVSSTELLNQGLTYSFTTGAAEIGHSEDHFVIFGLAFGDGNANFELGDLTLSLPISVDYVHPTGLYIMPTEAKSFVAGVEGGVAVMATRSDGQFIGVSGEDLTTIEVRNGSGVPQPGISVSINESGYATFTLPSAGDYQFYVALPNDDDHGLNMSQVLFITCVAA